MKTRIEAAAVDFFIIRSGLRKTSSWKKGLILAKFWGGTRFSLISLGKLASLSISFCGSFISLRQPFFQSRFLGSLFLSSSMSWS